MMTPISARAVWLGAALALLTATLALVSLSSRWRVEHANGAAALALEFEVVEAVAANSREDVPQLLRELAELPATVCVVIAEDTVGSLESEGRLSFRFDSLGDTYLVADVPTLARVRRSLDWAYGVRTESESGSVRFNGPSLAQLRALPLGLDPAKVDVARVAGIPIIARHWSVDFAPATYAKHRLQESAEHGAWAYLPMGDRVLGYPATLKETVDALEAADMAYLSPEFVTMLGEAKVLNLAPDQVVRLHSVQQAESDRMTPEAVRERFVRAYRERNMRVLLFRPAPPLKPGPPQLIEQAKALNAEIPALSSRIPTPFADPTPAPGVIPALALLAAAFGVWVGWQMVPQMLLRGLGVVLLLGLAVRAVTGSAGQLATLTAIVFPLGAYVVLTRGPKWHPILTYLAMSGLCLTGGLAVAGLLNGPEYMVKAQQFSGVKIAHFLPILIVGLWLLASRVPLRSASREPITWGAAVLSIVGLAALAVMATRTGNEGAGVTGVELQFRSLLESVAGVRPRTKEAFLGHPALIVGLLMVARAKLAQDRRLDALGVALIAVGAIGQTSIVNTLCHLHTPLEISLIRIGLGVVVGLALGLAVWAALRATWLRGNPS